MDAASCRDLVHRYYDELWNEWRVELIEELLSPDLRFRGSLGTTVEGRDDFRGYLLGIRQAMPDYRNEVEWLVAEEGSAAARLLYTGTHEGPLFGVPGDGHRISYQGASFFRMTDGVVSEIWTLGDLSSIRRQLLGSTPTA